MSALHGNSRPPLHSLLMIAGMLIVSGLVVVSCGSGGSSSTGPGVTGPGGTGSGVTDPGGTDSGVTDPGGTDSVSCAVNDEQDGCDKDSDTIANGVDNCPAVANASQSNIDGDSEGDACDSDIDNDMVDNAADVDDDNDGLIELYNTAMLWAVHCDPDGASYTAPMTAADGSVMLGGDGRPVCGTASTDGAADTATTDCTAETAPSSGIYLCGYELGASFDFPADWVSLPDRNLVSFTNGSFSGIFEGNGYELSNLNYMSLNINEVGGLFDSLEAESVIIRNLRVSGLVRTTGTASFTSGSGVITGAMGTSTLIAVSSAATFIHETSQPRFIGGLSGTLDGRSAIYSSFANGRLQLSSGSANLGGLAGETFSGSTVANSYVDDPADMSAALTGSPEVDQIGGLASRGGTAITNSYVSATIDGMAGADNVGGLVGFDSSTVTSSYYDMGTLTIGSGDTENMIEDAMGTPIGLLGTPASAAQLMGCDESSTPLTGNPATLTGCDGIYVGWSPAIWDFGTAEQLPALKYAQIDEVAGDECSSTDGAAVADLPFRPNAIAQPYCGTLLPGQGR